MARPEPMNATPTHSKAKVSLFFPDPLFVAGEHVSGKMELECKAERGLGIGDIKVELFAIQELTSRDHSATNTFLHLTRYFQGPGLPPSNAVHPHPLPGDDNVLPVDYYLARKGRTTFFFRFPLPLSSPASIDFGKGLAKLKYEVRASVGVSWRSERQRVMERREVAVVEAPEDALHVEQIVVGENGKIWAQGRVLNPYVIAGQDACVELFIKNHSIKRTTSLSLTLTRYLHLPAISQLKKSLQLSDVLTSVPFRGPEYIVQAGTEGVANLVFSVPKDAQGVRPGRLETGEEDVGREPVESLFDVQCMIEIKIGMGLGNKDIVIELPITIVHAAAMRLLPPLPDPFVASPEPPLNVYSPPALSLSSYQSPPLGPTFDAYTAAFISPPLSPPTFPPNLPASSPPPQVIPPQMIYDRYYYYPPPLITSYALPARPSSADPSTKRPLPNLPTQNVHFTARPPTQDGGVSESQSSETQPEQGEPGKGERASRISAHLRMSSRNRSVSPQAHRFPQISLAPESDKALTQLQLTPPPANVEFPRTSPTENHQLLSPRPVLTPKQSFSFDRGTVKSDHVIDLERMAAEQETKHKTGNEGSKSLPAVPVPFETPDTPRLPPEPTLLPIPTHQRPEYGTIWDRESGLTALERKLLEQVGTRKPDSARRVDVRSVLPEPIKIPSPNDPRCDPLNDSAISSLALGADISFDDEHPAANSKKALPSTPPISPKDQILILDRHMVNGREKKKRNHVNHAREAATGRVAAWLGGLNSASPPEILTPPINSPAAPVQDLPSPTELDPHPLLRSSPGPAPHTSDVPMPDTIPTRSSGFVLQVAKDTSSSFKPVPLDESDSRQPPRSGHDSSSATPKASSPSPMKPVLRRLAHFPNNAQALDHKYDVRSARGGRGGKVASVATLWASLASQQEAASPSGQRTEKAGTFSPTFKGVQTKTSPNKHSSPPHLKKRHDDTNGNNVADLTARRARMVKSTSVPAVVSSSLAIPVLSSTASLARPIQAPYPKRSYPPTNTTFTIAEHTSPQPGSSTPKAKSAKSPVSNDLAFGQARLKDLIKKYQQV